MSIGLEKEFSTKTALEFWILMKRTMTFYLSVSASISTKYIAPLDEKASLGVFAELSASDCGE